MNVKLTPWMLAVAAFLMIAVLAVGFLLKRLFAVEPKVQPVVERRNVPMALSDIAPGTLMKANYIGDGPVNTRELTRDTILSSSGVIGRIARNKIEFAQPFKLTDFYPFGEGPEIELTPGNRLVSVDVGTSTNLVSGFVKEGNYVDVLMTVDGTAGSATSARDAMTLQLFDGVKVFAVNGNKSSSVIAGQNEVTLELTLQQQKVMVLTKEKGRISLSYNPDGPGNGGLSIQTSKSDRVRLSEILGIDEPEEDEKPFVTEQYRNGTHRNVYYDKDGRAVDGRNRNLGGGGRGGTPLNGSGDIDVDSTSVDQPAAGQKNQQPSLVSSIGF
jgi:pilus assembly protein CpaB